METDATSAAFDAYNEARLVSLADRMLGDYAETLERTKRPWQEDYIHARIWAACADLLLDLKRPPPLEPRSVPGGTGSWFERYWQAGEPGE